MFPVTNLCLFPHSHTGSYGLVPPVPPLFTAVLPNVSRDLVTIAYLNPTSVVRRTLLLHGQRYFTCTEMLLRGHAQRTSAPGGGSAKVGQMRTGGGQRPCGRPQRGRKRAKTGQNGIKRTKIARETAENECKFGRKSVVFANHAHFAR